MASNKFAFKPEVEKDIMITHPDLVGDAENDFKVRKDIFDKKFSNKIVCAKFVHYSTEYKRREKKKKILKEEEEAALKLENISTKNWLTDDEERALFVEHYVEEIRSEVDKKHRCETWVKEHFF